MAKTKDKQPAKVHPVIDVIRKTYNTKSTVEQLGDYVEWKGFVVLSKDVSLRYTGKSGKPYTKHFKASETHACDYVDLRLFVTRSIQEGPEVRRGNDNPNKWNEGKPRAKDPLVVQAFDNLKDAQAALNDAV